jgi:exopolysaccharide production protein ExoZ
VVLHFYFDAARFTGLPLNAADTFEAGVDLFFVISGFVMVISTNDLFGKPGASADFLVRRTTRIVPIYWLVTAIYVAAAILLPSYRDTFSLPLIIASFLFVPWPRPDGILQPVVGQGWTLQLEMFFYVLFATTLLFQRRGAVLTTSAMLIAAVAIGLIWPLPDSIAFFTNPMMLEFALGMCLGLAYANGVRFPRSVAWAIFSAGVLILLFDIFEAPKWSEFRPLRWGVPALLIVAGVGLSRHPFNGQVWRRFAFVGQASYALYLLHSLPNRAVIWSAKAIGIDIASAAPILMLLALIASIGLSVGVHYMIELPTTRLLRRWFHGSNLEATKT